MSGRGALTVLTLVVSGVALAGCGADDDGTAAATTTSASAPTPSVSSQPRTTVPTAAVPTTAVSTTAARTTAQSTTTTATKKATSTTKRPKATAKASTRTPAKRPSPSTSEPVAKRCDVPDGVTAPQVVLVNASGSRATIRACRRSKGHYLVELGPYSGHVGKNGVSSGKREGDLRTPAGVFPLRGGFGARPDPGLRIGSWDRVDSRDVWVDDPSSDLYNTHQRTPAGGRWDSAEKLLNQPAYDYAQVIGYNEGRTPGRARRSSCTSTRAAGRPVACRFRCPRCAP